MYKILGSAQIDGSRMDESREFGKLGWKLEAFMLGTLLHLQEKEENVL